MRIITKKFKLNIKRDTEFVDITKRVQEMINKTKVSHGAAMIFTRHTTSAVRINENEPLLMDDIRDFLHQLAPRNTGYRHDQLEERDCLPDERINAHSHLRSLIMGASENVPIIDGELHLGKWQSIFFVDLDGCNREREIVVQVLGE